MKNQKKFLQMYLLLSVSILSSIKANAQVFADVEGGAILHQSKNLNSLDFNATRFDLAKDFKADPTIVFRIKLGYLF